jgi:hypothetical protein
MDEVAPPQEIQHESDHRPCTTCAAATSGAQLAHVYVVGQVAPRFPQLGIEKEFAQATGRADTKGLSDSQALHAVLTRRENRYLARQVCWVLTVGGVDTYLLTLRAPADLDLLLETVRPTPRPTDVDVVIGVRGPLAPPEMCNGLIVPILAFDQIYSFDRDSLIKAIPRPERIAATDFGPAAEALYDRIMQMADNAGATDEHRALNYLAVRYPEIYAAVADYYSRNCSLARVETRPSRLVATRRLLDVVFSFRDRATDVLEQQFCRVDVTEEFPFLVSKLSPCFERET